jgi:RNA polymerase sigma factor (sigma-70 family)
VLRVCRAVLGDRHDAEDAWAETFLAALRAYPELPAEANVQAWLVTIGHRRAIDVVRARRRRPVPVADPPEAAVGPPEEPDEELRAAVDGLTDRQRRAVAYHYLADLPYAEVADLLGGTPEAARRAAADGIRNLRRRLAGSSTGDHQ